MAPSPELLERTFILKHELVSLASSRQFRREVDAFVSQALGGRAARDTNELAFAMDSVMLGQRLSSGLTILDHYLAQHPTLSDTDREIVAGWRKIRKGVFRIDATFDDSILTYNLVDDLTYRVYSNIGPDFVDQVRVGWFLLARLAQIGGDWVISGGIVPIAADQVASAYRIATAMTTADPNVVFQNPELLRIGWDLQRKEREGFIQFFGSDMVTLRSSEFARRMDEYMRWRTFEMRDETGKTAADRTMEHDGVKPAVPQFEMPDGLKDGETIGVIYDDFDGLHEFPDFGPVEEVFADPDLLADEGHREAVVAYLESPGIIPLPLRRLGDRDPDHATIVFRTILDEPGFRWERDGESLLRDYKAWYDPSEVLPSVSPIPDGLAEFQRRSTASKHVGRNDPCPCGSGRKFKHCHGRTAR